MEKEGEGRAANQIRKNEIVKLSSVGARNEETMLLQCALQTLDREVLQKELCYIDYCICMS